MSSADWLKVAGTYAVLALAGFKTYRSLERGEIVRSMSLASVLASVGVCVYSALAAIAVTNS